MNGVAKKIRLHAQKKKAEEREEAEITKQVEKQLRQDLQLSKKGNQQSLKPQKQALKTPKIVIVDKDLIEPTKSSPPRETRTRKVRLPHCYRK